MHAVHTFQLHSLTDCNYILLFCCTRTKPGATFAALSLLSIFVILWDINHDIIHQTDRTLPQRLHIVVATPTRCSVSTRLRPELRTDTLQFRTSTDKTHTISVFIEQSFLQTLLSITAPDNIKNSIIFSQPSPNVKKKSENDMLTSFMQRKLPVFRQPPGYKPGTPASP